MTRAARAVIAALTLAFLLALSFTLGRSTAPDLTVAPCTAKAPIAYTLPGVCVDGSGAIVPTP